jgi:omega-amidase
VVFNPDGVRASAYDQIHLSSIAAEPDYIAPGARLPFFDALTFRAATIGSYDLRFPELAREFGLSWGFLLFVGGAYRQNEIHQWDALLQARAVENQMFAIGCNFGSERRKEKTDGDDFVFGGHSAVYAPDGRMLHRAGENEQVLVLDINPFEVEWCRNRFQYLTDAKVELHKRHVFESEDDPDK